MIITKTGDKYYKLALHLHTTLSDGKKTPEEVAKVKGSYTGEYLHKILNKKSGKHARV